MYNFIEAVQLKIGYEIAENDGFLLTVDEIVKETEKSITVKLINDTCINKYLWSVNGGIIKTFRKNTKVCVTLGDGVQLDILKALNKISVRTYNTLKRAGYNDLFTVLKTDAETIQSIYNMSKCSLKEIQKLCMFYFNEYQIFS